MWKMTLQPSSDRPYCLGIPILGMEFMLGQVLQKGVTDGMAMLHARAWGIGAAASLASFLLASYYSIIMSWVWSFLVASMREVMPFSDGRAADFFYTDVLAARREAARGRAGSVPLVAGSGAHG
jgi:NSS family neurotransmitter:Na+ symporter